MTEAFDLARERGFIDDAVHAVAGLAKAGGDAARRDLYRAVSAITEDLVRANLEGRDDMVAELLAQSAVVVEIERVRALEISAAAVRTALATATRLVSSLALRLLVPPLP